MTCIPYKLGSVTLELPGSSFSNSGVWSLSILLKHFKARLVLQVLWHRRSAHSPDVSHASSSKGGAIFDLLSSAHETCNVSYQTWISCHETSSQGCGKGYERLSWVRTHIQVCAHLACADICPGPLISQSYTQSACSNGCSRRTLSGIALVVRITSFWVPMMKAPAGYQRSLGRCLANYAKLTRPTTSKLCKTQNLQIEKRQTLEPSVTMSTSCC